jgi:Tfp pilus assembly protein PilN
MVAAVVAVAVPVIAAAAVFSCYLRNAIAISIKKQAIAGYEAKIDKLSDAVKLHKSREQDKSLYINSLSEVKSSIVNHTQWSDILTTVVENLPDAVVLTKLEVTEQHAKKRIPEKDDPKKTIDISVPVKTLKINVAGSPGSNCDEAVREFRNRLLRSQSLQQSLAGINVSATSGTLGEQEVISYEIDCNFKPPL